MGDVEHLVGIRARAALRVHAPRGLPADTLGEFASDHLALDELENRVARQVGAPVLERFFMDVVARHELDGARALLEHVGAAHGFDVEAGEQETDVGRVGGHLVDEHGPDRDERDEDLAALERRRGFDRLQEAMPEPEEAPLGAQRPRLVDHQVPVDLLDGALADVFP